ncbi:MAG: T9SS type A sorting domain-containing protein [Bacteroidota bacterium]
MRQKKLRLTALIFISFGLIGVQAQETIPASGGNSSGGGGSVSYSVGQITYSTNSGSNGSVLQGVQQPFEISEITAIEEAKGINLSLSVSPNPVTDHLTLRISDFEISNLSYQLYDLNGKLIETKNIESNQIGIETINLVPATYFLKVVQRKKEVKTFKIIKN